MSGATVAARIAIRLSVVMLVVAVVGFTVTLILNAFVLDKYNAYGEVPIPGTGSLQLPAGEVTVSFHTQVIGSPNNGGLPVPQLELSIDPPAGIPEPVVTESYGSTTTINNDSHIRVWLVQVPAAGTYQIATRGQVNGFISPRLAFGHGSSYGWLVWAFVALLGIGLLDLVLALWWTRRAKRRVVAAEQPFSFYTPTYTPTDAEVSAKQPFSSYTPTDAEVSVVAPGQSVSTHAPTDEGVKLERLKTLASLRDSGALTEAEFETEKRRILEGR